MTMIAGKDEDKIIDKGDAAVGCIKCGRYGEVDIYMHNWFSFHRYTGYNVEFFGVGPLKEFYRREFLKDMDAHFDKFKITLLCKDCISNFEWDLDRLWSQYTSEGIEHKAWLDSTKGDK